MMFHGIIVLVDVLTCGTSACTTTERKEEERSGIKRGKAEVEKEQTKKMEKRRRTILSDEGEGEHV